MASLPTPFFFTPLGTRLGILLTIWLSIIYGSAGALKLLIDLLLYRKSFFTRKDRKEAANRPPILDQYGNHEFIVLPKAKVKLHCVTSGSERKQVMLFVHGFPECWFSWRHQMEAFKEQYRVVGVNMRGYGESDKPRGVKHYSTDLLVADVIELLEILLTKSANKKAVLVAHDWGGIIAWIVAQMRPDLIDRFVVLNAPHPAVWRRRIATTWRQFFASYYMFFFNVPFLPEVYFSRLDYGGLDYLYGKYQSVIEMDAYKYYFSMPYGLTGPLNYYRASLRGYGSGKNEKMEADFAKKKIEPKTLIIWGTKDVHLITELAADSAKTCADATVELVEGCSHWIMVQQPERVNQIMGQFLKTV